MVGGKIVRVCAVVGLIGLLLIGQGSCVAARVTLGVDRFFEEGHFQRLKGKRVALISNQTGVNGSLRSTLSLLQEYEEKGDYRLVALFAPEHSWQGSAYSGEKVDVQQEKAGLPLYSLYGETRRPTAAMLEQIDLIIYDIQGIGVRSYTYATTLFYAMEEAARHKIEVVVLDRPNPMGGLLVDGGMLSFEWRSFIGYINVPYCHGMTIGELAHLFNEEYRIGCRLTVVPMKGWTRSMHFHETGLVWVPTSPHIPEATTPLFYASTGLLGELGLVHIGVGYTLPFRTVAAPWIDADALAARLNNQHLKGVTFLPFHYRPFYGSMKGKECHGVLLCIDKPAIYQPVKTQYLILGILKTLYPKRFAHALKKISPKKRRLFCLANGGEEVYKLLLSEDYVAWQIIGLQQKGRGTFTQLRQRYLIPHYAESSRLPIKDCQ